MRLKTDSDQLAQREDALTRAYHGIEGVFKHPLAGPCAVAFVIGWSAASYLSHGHFDPGETVGTYIQTSLQTFLMCLSCYMIGKSAKQAHEHHEATHKKLDEHHAGVKQHVTKALAPKKSSRTQRT